MERTTLKLQGMSCASCAIRIQEAIASVIGVNQCIVNFGVELATLEKGKQKLWRWWVMV